jgi:hypothetical protein
VAVTSQPRGPAGYLRVSATNNRLPGRAGIRYNCARTDHFAVTEKSTLFQSSYRREKLFRTPTIYPRINRGCKSNVRIGDIISKSTWRQVSSSHFIFDFCIVIHPRNYKCRPFTWVSFPQGVVAFQHIILSR